MCYLVFIGVAGFKGDVAAHFKHRHLIAQPAANRTADLLPGERFEVSDGHCACALYVGETDAEPFNEARERRRLARHGWKPARIERELQASRERHARRQSLEPETDFVASIGEMIERGARVALLGHMFRASFEDPFEIAGVTELPFAHFRESGGQFPPDRVVKLIV
jgi:hypothetical protein